MDASSNECKLRELSILYVGEHAEPCEMVERQLPAYKIVWASSAFEALRALHYGFFDAYVVNQWLPDQGGLQLCRAIRKADAHGPLFFCSVADHEISRRRALAAGASAYLASPIKMDLLREQLALALTAADRESLAAKRYADQALRNEAERCARKLRQLDRAVPMKQNVIERAVRTSVHRVFVAHRGTRANFERWWPQMLCSAIASNPVLHRLTRGLPAADARPDWPKRYAAS